MTTQWRLYDTYRDAAEAVRRLEQAGIPQSEIAIVGHDDVAGGIVDVLAASGVDPEDANLYAEAMRRGATLVSVRAGAAEDAEVRRLLASSRAVDVVERRRAYEETGWSFFDPTAIDYKATVEADARRHQG